MSKTSKPKPQVVSAKQDREPEQRLAINLFDLDRLSEDIRAKLLAGRIDVSKVIQVEKGTPSASAAVVFTCSLLTAAMICDILRSEDRKLGDYPTRVYLFRRSWSKVPPSAVLAIPHNGKCNLNPAFFDLGWQEGEANQPPAPKPVT